MIKYAEINSDNIVVNIIVSTESNIINIPGTFIKYGESDVVNRRDAVIGGSYNKEKDMFVYPSPFPSWVLDEETLEWESPIGPKPSDGKKYTWDEDAGSWTELETINIEL